VIGTSKKNAEASKRKEKKSNAGRVNVRKWMKARCNKKCQSIQVQGMKSEFKDEKKKLPHSF